MESGVDGNKGWRGFSKWQYTSLDGLLVTKSCQMALMREPNSFDRTRPPRGWGGFSWAKTTTKQNTKWEVKRKKKSRESSSAALYTFLIYRATGCASWLGIKYVYNNNGKKYRREEREWRESMIYNTRGLIGCGGVGGLLGKKGGFFLTTHPSTLYTPT